MTWNPGDRITWHYSPSKGKTEPIPGVVIEVKRCRVAIRVFLRGSLERRHVDPERITSRTQYVKGLDDE
ncbi:MAG TPA: hypothetical protein VJ654_17585 [Noviherbaspirillum sp.]|nr:hypothetical protein [Noviherbaspirillum sp.]